MKPTEQRKLYEDADGKRWGDCVAAVLASVLELPLDDVPAQEIALAPDQHEAINEFLEQFGLGFVRVAFQTAAQREALAPLLRGTYHTLGGSSPRNPGGSWGHEVVGFEGQAVHDPHPSKAGLLEVQYAGLFVMREPAKQVLRQRFMELLHKTRVIGNRTLDVRCMFERDKGQVRRCADCPDAQGCDNGWLCRAAMDALQRRHVLDNPPKWCPRKLHRVRRRKQTNKR